MTRQGASEETGEEEKKFTKVTERLKAPGDQRTGFEKKQKNNERGAKGITGIRRNG